MPTLAEIIQTRRSIGVFTDQPLPDGLIESLLEVAVYAPNHRLTEPWRFIYITGDGRAKYAQIMQQRTIEATQSTDPAAKQAAGEAAYAKFMKIPAFLAVIIRIHSDPHIAEEDLAATSALIQNLLLLAWEKGIGSAWKTFKNDIRFRMLFDLGEDEKVVGIIHFGYPLEVGSSTRKPAMDRITYLK